eukprot:TRINITY_DN2266_c0_g1_i1.p1 TRINITY_DN2266_c0_g1~~TRINITY_DN2266_c0_g1_i1.p1  ORF type:complete len:749 (-),score=267.83 TRINITY_DN2266_c0_g1_i1:207-2453(-)
MAGTTLRAACLAALLTPSLSADPKQSSAVAKVIEMMGDLKAKVEAEGVAESKAYDKFDRFCTETNDEKKHEIQTGEDAKAQLKATIKNGQAAEANQLDAISGVGGFEQTIAELEKNIADGAETRKKEKKAYVAANKEMADAIAGLDRAVAAMHASQPAMLLQQDTDTIHKLKTAALLADSMGLGGQTAFAALEAPTQDYNFHSGSIIETLEKLQAEFRNAKREADENEAKSMSSFTAAQIALNSDLTANQRAKEAAKEAKGAAKAKVGQAQKDLAETESELADDNKYLDELVAMCHEKKVTFDQRSDTRKEEIAAITEAVGLIKKATGAKDSGDSALLFEVAVKAAATPSVLRAAEADAERVEAKDGSAPHHTQKLKMASLLQKNGAHDARKQNAQFLHRYSLKEHSVTKAAAHTTSPDQKKLIDFLLQKGKETHFGRFVTLAQAASQKSRADVFAEIKKMIADQIDNLKNKAAESQSKKASCDKRISEASVKRDNAAREVKQYNTKMMQGEARRDALGEDMRRLKEEVKALTEEVQNATAMRQKESAENAVVVQEAEEAVSGIQAAMKVMKEYYAGNKDNSVSGGILGLAAKNSQPAKDAPDATFKNKQAYKGSQEASVGITGMLEVIESDFQRNIAETQAAEKQAAKAHKKFLGDSEITTGKKDSARKTKDKFHSETVEQLEQDESSIGTQLSVLKSAIGELASLDEECGVGISYEERKAAREEEIEALKEAIDHINSFILAQGLR